MAILFPIKHIQTINLAVDFLNPDLGTGKIIPPPPPVLPGPPIPTQPLSMVSPAVLPNANLGVPYAYQLQGFGGLLPYVWTLTDTGGSLNAWLLDSVSGFLTCANPADLEQDLLTITLADSAQSNPVSMVFSVTTVPLPTPTNGGIPLVTDTGLYLVTDQGLYLVT